MTADRTAGWGGVAVAGARIAAGLDATRRPWEPEPDMARSHRHRMLTVLAAAPGLLRGRRVCTLAAVSLKAGKRDLGRLAAAGLIVSKATDQSVLNRSWQLTAKGHVAAMGHQEGS